MCVHVCVCMLLLCETGGWIKHCTEVFPFFAPTVNSYKRFVSASWAPTKCAWSYDNRTAGFRIVGSGQSLRIEYRVCGADINPYLAFAASLAAGLDGIENEIDPSLPLDGNVYDATDGDFKSIPTSFAQSIEQFKESMWANDTFGEDVVKHYAHFYELERKCHEAAVSDWERMRYFEMI